MKRGSFNFKFVKTIVQYEFSGRLKNRWRCLHKSGGTLQYTPNRCCRIIQTCVLLENLCITLNVEDPEEGDDEDLNNDEDFLPAQIVEAQNPNWTRQGMEKRRQIIQQMLT